MYICEQCKAVFDDSSVEIMTRGFAGSSCIQGHWIGHVSIWLPFIRGVAFTLVLGFMGNILLLVAGIYIPLLVVTLMAIVGVVDMIKGSELSKSDRVSQARGVIRSARGTGILYIVSVAVVVHIYGWFGSAFQQLLGLSK